MTYDHLNERDITLFKKGKKKVGSGTDGSDLKVSLRKVKFIFLFSNTSCFSWWILTPTRRSFWRSWNINHYLYDWILKMARKHYFYAYWNCWTMFFLYVHVCHQSARIAQCSAVFFIFKCLNSWRFLPKWCLFFFPFKSKELQSVDKSQFISLCLVSYP